MRHRVLIVGGGTAGITTAAALRRKGVEDIAIIEPSETHYYQPLWTLVGAGVVARETTARTEASVMPKGVRWIRDRVKAFDPIAGAVETEAKGRVEYEFLVVAAGLQLDWDRVEGLRDALATPHVSSVYDYQRSTETWEMLRAVERGHVLFTCPPMPIKCAGAPQKIAYMMADHLKRSGRRAQCEVSYATATPTIFGVKEYAEILVTIAERHGIDVRYQHKLVGVDGAAREAVFAVTRAEETATERVPYEALHVVPPQSAPDFVKQSPLACQEGTDKGWMEVDKNTLQHPRYDRVFGLGDVTTTPNAKTGAAIRHQVPVLVENLRARIGERELSASYGGYGACPLVTARGKMLLAEFDYTKKPTPTLPINTMKERYSMWLLKRYALPWAYWNLMMRGIV
jgi:sulfide:quinone oxidoreductase